MSCQFLSITGNTYASCDGKYELQGWSDDNKPMYFKKQDPQRWIWWNKLAGAYICGPPDGRYSNGGFMSSKELLRGWNFPTAKVSDMSSRTIAVNYIPSPPDHIKIMGNTYASCDGDYFFQGMYNDKPMYKKKDGYTRWIWWDGSRYLCGPPGKAGYFLHNTTLLGDWNEGKAIMKGIAVVAVQ